MYNFNINRRNFLKSSTAFMAYSTLGARGLETLFNEKIRKVGLIGTGWYGKSDLFRLMQVANVEVLALCDVDRELLDEAAELVSKRQKSGKVPQKYNDYRKMLAQHEFDIVIIGTPDHWHALQAIDAIKAGAHVFLQKPISVDVIEGEAILAAARKYGKTVQIGTQRRSTPHLVDAKKKIVDAGLLGKVSHVDMCCYYHMRGMVKPDPQPVPDYLDYDMWTGPAPMRPYNPLVHPRSWRAFMEYGNGIVGDMCVHMLDMVRWMLDLGWPQRVTSSGGIFVDKASRANITDTQTAMFEFDNLNVVWNHRSWGTSPDPDYPWAATLYGDKGTLKLSVNSYDFIPAGRGDKIHGDVVMELEQYPEDKTEKDLERHVAPAVRGHMLDWLAAIENRGRPVADIEQGHISSVSCILANLAMKLGRTLEWDPAIHRVVGDDEANAMLARPYREPWVHPTPEKV
ncbi:MAG: Gfo/Idh/MocA family oxidoreductase [Saprospiraceae bacterium]|nr:Gfo/Idh/MocA family oxidoreductase [Saprospiraceae bacterium]